MFFSILINGVLGFGILLALMFCIGDIEAAIGAQLTLGYPFLEIFSQALNSRAGTTALAVIVIALATTCSVGVFAAATRMLWSFARDRGTPGWKTLSKVGK